MILRLVATLRRTWDADMRFATIGLLAALFVGACASPNLNPSNLEAAEHQKYQVGEKRYLGRYSDMMVWDGPPTSNKYEVFGTGTGTPISGRRNGRLGFVIESYTPPPNEGYSVKFDNGKRGWVKELDLLLSDNEEDHRKFVTEANREKAECDRKGGVRVGMTAAQVRASCWGSPRTINKTTTASGTREQWVYGGNNYVYLDNGVVTSIQH
jgi:hypothetical protein